MGIVFIVLRGALLGDQIGLALGFSCLFVIFRSSSSLYLHHSSQPYVIVSEDPFSSIQRYYLLFQWEFITPIRRLRAIQLGDCDGLWQTGHRHIGSQ